jgi:hypothetical protein
MSEWKTYKSLNNDSPDLLDYQDFNSKKLNESFIPKNQSETK